MKPVLESLIKARAECAGRIDAVRAELDKLLGDLAAIDRTLGVLGFKDEPGLIPRKVPVSREAANAVRLFIRRTLEASPEPMRAAEIAQLYRAAHGVSANDSHTRTHYRQRVIAALRAMKRTGEAEMVGKGLGAVWMRPGPTGLRESQ